MAGPGTHLHDILVQWFREDITKACKCKFMIRKMDQWGPAECKKHLPEILQHLRAEAKQRRWWIRYATLVPGSTLAIRKLVLEAIRRSEADAQP